MSLPDARSTSWLVTTGVVIALVVTWFLVTPTLLGELVFPSPASVGAAIDSLGWGLLAHSAATFGRVTLGWAIGVPLGILIGMTLSWSALLRAIFHPLIEAVRPLPPVALIPFFIIWFGLGLSGEVVLIALGCFMVMTVNTLAALATVPLVYIRAATALGAPRLELYRTVLLPAILPSLIGGFRIAAGLAFGLGTAAEFMGAQSGLGFLMMVARRTLNTNTILLGVIILALESYAFDIILRAAGRYLCRWTEAPIEYLEQPIPGSLRAPGQR